MMDPKTPKISEIAIPILHRRVSCWLGSRYCASFSFVMRWEPQNAAAPRLSTGTTATRVVVETSLAADVDLVARAHVSPIDRGLARVATVTSGSSVELIFEPKSVALGLLRRTFVIDELRARLAPIEREVRIRGTPPEKLGPLVAIVGSRRATPQGMTFAFELASLLAARGIIIGSGGALGIDSAAHEGALAARGVTFVLRPSGLDVTFPRENADLFRRVEETHGSLHVSLFPDAAELHGTQARLRNRALVLLANAVVVVQARFKSGSLNTASVARELEKPLFVVGGAPWDESHAGCNGLLKAGAMALYAGPESSAREILSCIQSPSLFSASQISFALKSESSEALPTPALFRDGDRSTTAPPEGCDDASRPEEERAILDLLDSAPLSIDAIALKLHVTTTHLAPTLLTLTLEGVVLEAPFQHYRRA